MVSPPIYCRINPYTFLQQRQTQVSKLNKGFFASRLSVSTLLMIKRASSYYLTELGTVAKLVLPVDVNELPMKINEQTLNFDRPLLPLSPEQAKVLRQIENSKIPVLVKGVTGSGKTEIYFHAILILCFCSSIFILSFFECPYASNNNYMLSCKALFATKCCKVCKSCVKFVKM